MESDYIKCGDCLELMKQLPGESIDMVITSPPYDNIRTYNGYSFDFEGIARELFRIVKDGGVIVWIVNDGTVNGSKTGTSFRQALFFNEIGFNIHDVMIWDKDSCAFPEEVRYSDTFEYMFVFSKGKPKSIHKICDRKNKYGGSKISGTSRNRDGTLFIMSGRKKGSRIKEFGERFNVWHISSVKNNKTGHPAVFPKDLVKDHIISWSEKDDIVLDCFMGSGTTALACMETERHYIGFEISKEYYEKALKRIDRHTWQIGFDFMEDEDD